MVSWKEKSSIMMKVLRLFIVSVVIGSCISIGMIGVAAGTIQRESYDAQWIKRNPETRLTVLERAVAHYNRAQREERKGNYSEAATACRDALFVVPEFQEARELLIALLRTGERNKEAEREIKRSMRYQNAISVPDEIQYLRRNMDRLKQLYKPSRVLDRIVFLLLFYFVSGILVYVIRISGCAEWIELLCIRMKRGSVSHEKLPTDVIVGEFKGEELSENTVRGESVLMVVSVFLFCGGIVWLMGVREVKHILLLTGISGTLISVIIYKLFIADEEPSNRFFQGR